MVAKYPMSPTSAREIRRLMKPPTDKIKEGIELCDKGLALLKKIDDEPVAVAHSEPAKTQKRPHRKAAKAQHPKKFDWHEFWEGVKGKK